jgi:hypothetical protein
MPPDLRGRTRLAIAVAVLAAIAPYLSTLADYFIQDDFGVVGLLSQKPAGYFPKWFVGTWMDDIWGYTPDEIRPFPAVTYQIAALWGAASPVANHVINIAFHAINVLLVFRIARAAAGLGVLAALAGALVFAWLPMQAESVAWITGRVDSMPACFYMASFLLFVRWRDTGRRALYASSIAFCFVALFTKQNTITLPIALVLYDVVMRRDWPGHVWQWLRPYMPYVVLTIGYLVLRWVLFGQVAREGLLTAERLPHAFDDLALHLKRMVYGGPGVSMRSIEALGWVTLAIALVSGLAVWFRAHDRGRLLRAAIYFLIVWIGLGAAPTLVAGYASPRHMYLASAGWAIGVALALDSLWNVRARWVRLAAASAAAAVIALYGVQLSGVIRNWHFRAALSRQAVAQVEREAQSAPEGTLLVVGVPRASWNFSVPHALRPPFTATDLTRRVAVITHSSLYCCSAAQWNLHTRQLLRDWRSRADRPPVIALYWHPDSGQLSRLTDAAESYLRFVMEVLPETGSSAAMDEAILDTFSELVVTRTARPRESNKGGDAGSAAGVQ